MNRRILVWMFVGVCVCRAPIFLQAQEFRLFDRAVQVHGYFSQGFVYTNDNNWLTMDTSSGSGAMTDFGLNVSSMVTDKLRVGAQGFDRNFGHLGEYHPSLDWAVVDYRFSNWFGVRGGKVKTTLGLYNDTQDLDFLRPYALLPQSMYPTDLRDATIAHLGGDIYGNVALGHSLFGHNLRHNLGSLSYTVYAGHRSDSKYSGYQYLLAQFGTTFSSFGGLQYGGDLRWKTPLPGLLIGVSRLDQDTNGKGTSVNLFDETGPKVTFLESSKTDWTNQYYGQYSHGKLQIDSEYRRYFSNDSLYGGIATGVTDVKGWYVAGSYRILKRLQLSSYYSRYTIVAIFGGELAAIGVPNETDTSLPANHIYDKVVCGRVDLNRFWNVKIEGHFMNGYGESEYPDGFYPQVNPNGFQTDTNALVVRTGVNF